MKVRINSLCGSTNSQNNLLSYFRITILIFILLSSISSTEAQTPVGAGQTYPTLKSAFDAINAGTLTGAVVLQITSSLTEAETAVLNVSGSSSANYTSVLVYPTGSGYSISGNISGSLINLNGADNVTIDGRVNQSGNKNLVISNSNNGSADGTSTIRFINSSENNAVKYCYIKGSTTCTTAGIIFFSTSSTGNGNDNNTVQYCDITKEGTNGANNGIYSGGTSGRLNSGNIITANNFYDILRLDASYYGLNINRYSTQWTVSDNSFYETSPKTLTASLTDYFIYILANEGNGDNFYISGNYIGGRGPQCGDSALTIDANGTGYGFYGIYINNNTVNTTSIQGNTIKNIAALNSSSRFMFNGIYFLDGKFDVGTSSPNYIGSSTGTGSILLQSACTAAGGWSSGIYSISTGSSVVNLSNNVIGSITVTNISTGTHSFRGIYTQISNGVVASTVSNNLIGSLETEKSINTITNHTISDRQDLGGIFNVSDGYLIITGNTISNLYNDESGTSYSSVYGIRNERYGFYAIKNNLIRKLSTSSKYDGYASSVSIAGIIDIAAYSGSPDTLTVSNNIIYDLSNTYTGAKAVNVTGIYFVNGWHPANSKISGNLIYNLTLAASASNAALKGIDIGTSGTTEIRHFNNNIINIGTNVSKNCGIYGFYLDGKGGDSLFIINNSVYIGGSGITGSSSNTFGIYHHYEWIGAGTYKLHLKNNIFSNARSNATGTGKHYAISLWSTSRLTIDFNDYYVSGTGGALGYYGVYGSGGVDKTTLADWKATTGQDNYSVNGNPYFLADSTLRIDSTNSGCWNVYKKGIPVQNITSDFRELPRSNSINSGPICLGAYEFATLTTPPVTIASGAPSPGGTTFYSQSDRKLFEIIWGASDKTLKSGGLPKSKSINKSQNRQAPLTLPSTVSLQYYSGQTPPDTANIPVAKIGKGYYYVDTDRDPASPYSIKVYWGNHELGNITDTSNIILAMYDIKRKMWKPFYRGYSGNWVSIVDHSSKTITVNGLTKIDNVRFAFTDNDQPLLNIPLTSGDYTVGISSASNYSTITEALSDAKTRGISGTVRFLLIDTLYSTGETFPLKIDSIPGSGVTNTLTLKPYSGVSPEIRGNNESGILDLNQCKYIIIDGSNGGKGKNLFIKNTSTSENNGVTICFKNDASYNTIINCNIIGSSLSSNGIIFFSDSIIATGYNNNVIENCSIYGGDTAASFGISLMGNILKYGASNKIIRNEIFDFSYCGISCNFFNNTEITSNNIYQTRTNTNETIYGIVLQYECKNTTISGNKVYNFKSSGFSPFYYGILVNSAEDTINIINNIICPDTSDTRGYVYGIASSGYLNYINILNNLVLISGSGIINGNSYCINIFRQSYDSVYNNILINTRSNGAGTGKHYALYLDSVNMLNNFNSDNNDIYINGNGCIAGYDGTANRNTLSDWTTATSNDIDSYTEYPPFISSSDFLIDSTNSRSQYLYQKGRPFDIVPTDYRGIPRSTSPLTGPTCIGPYEFEFTTNPNWLEGTVYVGIGEEIKTLTDANGLFNKINNSIITGNLIVNITSDLTETGTIALRKTQEESGYKIRIQPNAPVNRTLSGFCSKGLIRLYGADRVTIDGSYNGSGNYLTIQNNNSSANSAAVQIASMGDNLGATYDTIKNCNLSAGSLITFTSGIFIGDSSCASSGKGYDNDFIVISNNNISKCQNGIFVYGVADTGIVNNLVITGNTIGSDYSHLCVSRNGLDIKYCTSLIISKNNIYNMISDYSEDITIRGISLGYVTDAEIFKNIIHSFEVFRNYNNIVGIDLWSSTGISNIRIFNNILSDFKCQYYCNVNALNIANGDSVKIYYNTVNLSNLTKLEVLSSALFLGSGITNCDIENNVLINSHNSISGIYAYAIISECSFSDWNNNINYNDYYTRDSGVRIAKFQGTDKYSLAEWKASVQEDSNSISKGPVFKSNNVIPYISSPLISAGIPVTGITDDYIDSLRNAIHPSIGAYEKGVDFYGPLITYTPLSVQNDTTNRILTDFAFISDTSGVDTSSGKRPRIYYRKSVNSNTYAGNSSSNDGWKWTEATNTTSPFSYIIDYSLLYPNGQVSRGDMIIYFIVAEDQNNPANISYYKGVLDSAPTDINLNPANFPMEGKLDSFSVILSISGTFNVGIGQYYTTLTGEGGLFQAINNGIVNGDISAFIVSDITEPGTYPLYEFSNNYSLRIKPDSPVNRILSGSCDKGLIKLFAADRVTIDGSYDGSGNYITIKNTNRLTRNTAAIQIASVLETKLNAATKDTIKNCNIETIKSSDYEYPYNGIYLGGASYYFGGKTDSIAILNNIISSCYNGIFVRGFPDTVISNLCIKGNTIGSYTDEKSITNSGINIGYCSTVVISDNKILNLHYESPSKGIAMASVNDVKIFKNSIQAVQGTGVDLWGDSGNSDIKIYDNILYDFRDYNNTPDNNTYVIKIESGSDISVYYNSTNVNQLQSNYVYTIWLGSGVSNCDIKNNSFASFQSTSIRNSIIYANCSFTNNNINYNDYYTSGSNGYVGYYNSNYQTTLADWKAVVPKDSNSISVNPNYNNDTNLIPQLYSSLLNAGTPLSGYYFDYLDTLRNTFTPSIGAYEKSRDLSGPVISYTKILRQNSFSNLTLDNFAQISDSSGVDTASGKRPRIYYKNSSDNNSYSGNSNINNGWKWTEATNTSTPYSFIIDYSKLYPDGTVDSGDVIQYFVVAQDLEPVPNVSINNGIFSITQSGVNLESSAYPIVGTINNYGISNIILVGVGKGYTTLTASDGLFNAINNEIVRGNLIIKITSDITEPGTVALNQTKEEAEYYIKIQPDSAVTRTLSGSCGNGLIRFNNSDRVTLDGSYNGSGKYLTIRNNSTSAYTAAIHFIGDSNGVTNDTVRNCIIVGAVGEISSGIFIGGPDILDEQKGMNNDGIVILNNNISRCEYGIYLESFSNGLSDNLKIIGNYIGSDDSAYFVTRSGIDINGCLNPEIKQNTIYNIRSDDNFNDIRGISIGYTTYADISANNIHGFRMFNSNQIAFGIDIWDSKDTSITIYNNIIYDLNSNRNSDAVKGININAGNNHKIYYNTVNLFGQFINNVSTSSYSLYISANLNCSVFDNLLCNSMTGGIGTKSYAIYLLSASSVSEINYNDYYASGPYGKLGYYNGADKITIEEWKAALSSDSNSLSVNPVLKSDTVLIPQQNSPVISVGIPVTGITNDYLGTLRSSTNPSIGAYEKGNEFTAPVITYTTLSDTISRNSRTLTATIFDTSGIPETGSFQPRIYYRKNYNGSWVSTQGSKQTENISHISLSELGSKYQENKSNVRMSNSELKYPENRVTENWNFTIDTSLIGQLFSSDSVYYYVIAQDISTPPNIGANPSGVTATDVNTITAHPPNPNSYTIIVRDTIAPVITYTLLSDTIYRGNRTLITAISDASGVPESGSYQPRIYFKKNYYGSWVSTQGSKQTENISNIRLSERNSKYQENKSNIRMSNSELKYPENRATENWNFTIDTSLIGQLNSSDSVYYYVIAQDNIILPNVGSNPSGVEATDVNTITAHPPNPNSYCYRDEFIIFKEDFEGSWTTPSTLNPAWSCPQTGDNEWHMNNYSTGWTSSDGSYGPPNGADSTSQSARFHSYDGTAGNGDLITPVIDFSSYPGIKNYNSIM
ncbi:MAG: right-handed parallel beta-helix repeat-containing protein [Ignavibacteria bacterium]